MSLQSFAASIEVASSKPAHLQQPKKSLQPLATRSSRQDVMPDIEMNSLPNPSMSNVSFTVESVHESDNDETASPSSPPGQSSEQVQTIWNPYWNRFRVMAACLTSFANGMNDSAPGALIASIENQYDITYGTVSLIFVCNALGFIATAFFISSLSTSLGRAKCLIISQLLLLVGYATIVTTPPFAAIAFSFFILGIGLAMNLAIGQVFVANLANNTAILGIYQGSYGIGGIIGPLIATALVSRGALWSRFYLIELGFAALNLFLLPWTFWHYEVESESLLPSQPSEQAVEETTKRAILQRKIQSIKTLLSNKPTVLGAVFIFAYQGAEVAISGWIISFLVQFRHGDPTKVGYVTSGFWAGITIGRLTLSFLAHRTGERRFVFIVTAGALILELLIWFVPSLPSSSILVAFSGLLLGPVYPCAVSIFQRLIPRKMMISSLSLVGSVGSSGGAFAPFMTGILAQKYGTFVLHPICIGLFVAMGVTWWVLPETEKRDE